MTQKQQSDGPLKKAYRSPQLLEYGSVAKLTGKKSGPNPDGKSGMTMVQMCL